MNQQFAALKQRDLHSASSSRARIAASAGLCIAAAWLAASASTVIAQAPTTIQLPEFHEFSISTSVLVPDRGGIVLGGVSRSSQSSVSRGVPGASKIPGAGRLFGNRAISRETSASTASAHAWIHDLDELDAATLAAARREAGPAASRSLDAQIERKADFLAKHVGRPATASAASSTATAATTAVVRGASARERTSQSPPALRLGTYDSRR